VSDEPPARNLSPEQLRSEVELMAARDALANALLTVEVLRRRVIEKEFEIVELQAQALRTDRIARLEDTMTTEAPTPVDPVHEPVPAEPDTEQDTEPDTDNTETEEDTEQEAG